MKKSSLGIMCGFILVFLLSSPVHTCVGRVLTLAVTSSPDQLIMAQMLSILINERTGTTVEVVQPGDIEKCHEALLTGKADIYINYIGVGLANAGASKETDDPQEAYTLVSQLYMDRFAMVWLKPFGFTGPLTVEANPNNKERLTLAAPVATKDVLTRFPVLDRLINKLGGRIGADTMDELRQKIANQDIKVAVKAFLESQKLI